MHFATYLRQNPGDHPFGWEEAVTGYDFGLLSPGEIRAWAAGLGCTGEAVAALIALEGEMPPLFEKHLWAAAAEATGRTPRPGSTRWARAQDRWRLALLKDALDAPLSPEALAVAVEAIYQAVGCPEDMIGLWKSPPAWERKAPHAEKDIVAAFVRRAETTNGVTGSA